MLCAQGGEVGREGSMGGEGRRETGRGEGRVVCGGPKCTIRRELDIETFGRCGGTWAWGADVGISSLLGVTVEERGEAKRKKGGKRRVQVHV